MKKEFLLLLFSLSFAIAINAVYSPDPGLNGQGEDLSTPHVTFERRPRHRRIEQLQREHAKPMDIEGEFLKTKPANYEGPVPF